MIVVPFPINQAYITGEDIYSLSFGDSVQQEKRELHKIQKDLEKFEINYGQPMDSIIRYDDRRNHNNNNNNNNINHTNVSHTHNTSKDTSNGSVDTVKDDTEWDELYGLYNLEPFHGSHIIENNEKILSAKSVIISILFLLVSHSAVSKISDKISKKVVYVSSIVIQSIFFSLLFYVIEKYLLR